MDQYTALLVFKTMVLPFFDYGCIFLTALPVRCFHKLQVYCNIALRVCFRIADPQDCPVKMLYKKAKMLPLDLRRIYFQLTTCHRMVYAGKVSVINPTGTRGTGAPQIKLPRHRLVQYLRGPSYQAGSHWNALSPNIRWLVDKDAFRINIKRRLGKLFIRDWHHERPYLHFEGIGILNEFNDPPPPPEQGR